MGLRDYIITGEVYNKVKEMTKEELMELDMFDVKMYILQLEEELEKAVKAWRNVGLPANFKKDIIKECKAVYNEELDRLKEINEEKEKKHSRTLYEYNTLQRRLVEDEEFRNKLCLYSNCLKVLVEIFDAEGELWGYLVQNCSLRDIRLNDGMYELKSAEIKEFNHADFIRMTCQPEVSFKLLNGKVRTVLSFEDMDDIIENDGIEEGLKKYQFVPYENDLNGVYRYIKYEKKQSKNTEKTD